MKSVKFLLLSTVLLGFGFASSGALALSKAEHKIETDRIQAEYKAAREQCGSFSGQAKNVCIEEAKAVDTKARAKAEADYRQTPKATKVMRDAYADADYRLARVKCNALSGNLKDVCIRQASAVQVKAKADARVAEVAAQANAQAAQASAKAEAMAAEKISKADAQAAEATARADANADTRIADARADAAQEKRAANYKLARQRCESLAGEAKDRCQADAKRIFEM